MRGKAVFCLQKLSFIVTFWSIYLKQSQWTHTEHVPPSIPLQISFEIQRKLV